VGGQVAVQRQQAHGFAPRAGAAARVQFAVVLQFEAGLAIGIGQARTHHGDALLQAVFGHAGTQAVQRFGSGLEGPDMARASAARDLQRVDAVVGADVQRVHARLQQQRHEAHLGFEPGLLFEQHVGRQAAQ
jgi:hypothetical protein